VCVDNDSIRPKMLTIPCVLFPFWVFSIFLCFFLLSSLSVLSSSFFLFILSLVSSRQCWSRKQHKYFTQVNHNADLEIRDRIGYLISRSVTFLSDFIPPQTPLVCFISSPVLVPAEGKMCESVES